MDDVYKQFKKILVAIVVPKFSFLNVEVDCTSIKASEFYQP